MSTLNTLAALVTLLPAGSTAGANAAVVGATDIDEEGELARLLAEEVADIVEQPQLLDPVDKLLADVTGTDAQPAVAGNADVQALYQQQPAPTDDPEAIKTTEGAPAKGKRGRKAAAPKALKEPKPHKPTYAANKRSEVLASRLGATAGDTLLLVNEDALLEGVELEKRQREIKAMIDTCPQKKVAEKGVMLFGWMSKGGKLNDVMHRAFKVLIRDGEITTGSQGNLHKELASKPYSPGTCSAQAGQIACLFPMLGITGKEKGKLVANSESVILAKVKSDLF